MYKSVVLIPYSIPHVKRWFLFNQNISLSPMKAMSQSNNNLGYAKHCRKKTIFSPNKLWNNETQNDQFSIQIIFAVKLTFQRLLKTLFFYFLFPFKVHNGRY